MSDVLARADEALDTEDFLDVLARHVGDSALTGVTDEYDTLTLHVAPDHWVPVVQALRDQDAFAFDLFDSLFGVDDREDGFRVVAVLYSTSMGVRVLCDVKVPGGREAPVLPTLTGLYDGANWMERETWDMFGIEFEGHPGLAPRILNVENFEGWPLRKDFHLASRVAKPWPGVKEPAETDEDGNVIEREPGLGDAPGPTDLDKAMAAHAKQVNAPDEPEPAPDPVAADAPEPVAAADAPEPVAAADAPEPVAAPDAPEPVTEAPAVDAPTEPTEASEDQHEPDTAADTDDAFAGEPDVAERTDETREGDA